MKSIDLTGRFVSILEAFHAAVTHGAAVKSGSVDPSLFEVVPTTRGVDERGYIPLDIDDIRRLHGAERVGREMVTNEGFYVFLEGGSIVPMPKMAFYASEFATGVLSPPVKLPNKLDAEDTRLRSATRRLLVGHPSIKRLAALEPSYSQFTALHLEKVLTSNLVPLVLSSAHAATVEYAIFGDINNSPGAKIAAALQSGLIPMAWKGDSRSGFPCVFSLKPAG